MSNAEVWGLASNIVSLLLGILAMGLSIWFFILSKDNEKAVSKSLVKIETQADNLQKLSSRYMDRLTKYVTEDRPDYMEESFPTLINILSQLPQTITATITQISPKDNSKELTAEIYNLYIALYFYVAQTNYWAQFYLPKAAEFNSNDQFHELVKRIVDMSNADFDFMANVLAKCDQAKLEGSSLAHLLNETKDFWRNRVRSVADVFVAQQQQG